MKNGKFHILGQFTHRPPLKICLSKPTSNPKELFGFYLTSVSNGLGRSNPCSNYTQDLTAPTARGEGGLTAGLFRPLSEPLLASCAGKIVKSPHHRHGSRCKPLSQPGFSAGECLCHATPPPPPPSLPSHAPSSAWHTAGMACATGYVKGAIFGPYLFKNMVHCVSEIEA